MIRRPRRRRSGSRRRKPVLILVETNFDAVDSMRRFRVRVIVITGVVSIVIIMIVRLDIVFDRLGAR